MKPQSAKAKGRNLQKWVRDELLKRLPQLEPEDAKSTSSGAGGEDVQLSPAARKLFPYQIECKNLAKIAVYNYYMQCQKHGKHQPIVFIKQNHAKPLVVIDAEYFMDLVTK